MKVIIKRSTRINGESVEPSSKPIEVSKKDGELLISMGKAEIAKAPAKSARSDKADD